MARLPTLLRDLADRWALTLTAPFDSDDVSCAWVAVAAREDGSSAVLKVGMPHMEGEHEIQGLRFWDGDPTVLLLEADEAANAMLLERCEPGTSLRHVFEPDQDAVIAGLLRRLWRRPPPPDNPFRALSTLMSSWRDEVMADAARWSDAGLVRAGLELQRELSTTGASTVVLATDLHAGNVLRARRRPWMVIDPKPFVGDAAYDATQHLLNCRSRLRARPADTIRRFADLLDVEHERVHLWTFARAAAEPRHDWSHESMELARALAP
ncbi:MAG TPA: aminoglycoside phosphotransferase family protein [Gemmatimonadaceae bacterium]